MPLRMRQPDAANPVTLGYPAKQQRTQPEARCECGAWLSKYRHRLETLCSACQYVNRGGAQDWGAE